MPRFKFVIIFLLSISINSAAQKSDSVDSNPHRELVVRWDNDAFFDIDYYYTQGAHFVLIHPALRKNPLNLLLLGLKKSDRYYGLGAERAQKLVHRLTNSKPPEGWDFQIYCPV